MLQTTTPRLAFRGFEGGDLPWITSLLRDREVMKWTGFRVPQPPERARVLLDKWCEEGTRRFGVWAAVEKEEGRLVGWAMLKPTDSACPELGYMLPRQEWGKGLATEIAFALVKYGFEQLGLSTIRAVTSPENAASIRILKKVGMERGEGRADGGVYFELSKPPPS